MDSLFSKLQEDKEHSTTSSHDDGNPTKQHHHHPSNSELMASAKYLAEAAKATFSHESDSKVDKAKAAGAAEDILSAASKYGKLEGTSFGKYVEKAEDYLHQYHSSSHSTSTTTTHTSGHSSHGGHNHGSSSAAPSGGGGGGDEKSGGGYGDYLKMAQGFLKK